MTTRPLAHPECQAVAIGIVPASALGAVTAALRMKLLRRPLEALAAAQGDPNTRRDLKKVHRFRSVWEVRCAGPCTDSRHVSSVAGSGTGTPAEWLAPTLSGRPRSCSIHRAPGASAGACDAALGLGGPARAGGGRVWGVYPPGAQVLEGDRCFVLRTVCTLQ